MQRFFGVTAPSVHRMVLELEKRGFIHREPGKARKRRGDKKAIVAVAHSLLVAAYHILRDAVPYADLGPAHFDRLHQQRLLQYHRRRLTELRYEVTITEKPVAA